MGQNPSKMTTSSRRPKNVPSSSSTTTIVGRVVSKFQINNPISSRLRYFMMRRRKHEHQKHQPPEQKSTNPKQVSFKLEADAVVEEEKTQDDEEQHPVFSRTESKRGKSSFKLDSEELQQLVRSNSSTTKPQQEESVTAATDGDTVESKDESKKDEETEENALPIVDSTTTTTAPTTVPFAGLKEEELTEKINHAASVIMDPANTNLAIILENVIVLRKILSIAANPPIQAVVDTGVTPILLKLIQDHPEENNLIFESSWALTNIASGVTAYVQLIVDHGAIELFVGLLTSSSKDVVEQAVWCLGNIAGDAVQYRNMVLQTNLIPVLLTIYRREKAKGSTSLMRNLMWLLSNLCRNKPQPPLHQVSPILPLIVEEFANLEILDMDILVDALWTLSYLSDGTDDRIETVANSGIIPSLIVVLSDHPNYKKNTVRTPAVRTLGNLVAGSDVPTQMVIDAGAIKVLSGLIDQDKNESNAIIKEACWSLSNITAGQPAQVSTFLKESGAGKDIKRLILAYVQGNGGYHDIAKEAVYVLANAMSGVEPKEVNLLLDEFDAMYVLFQVLLVPDSGIANVAFTGVEAMLVKAGVNKLLPYVHKMDAFKEHNESIINWAHRTSHASTNYPFFTILTAAGVSSTPWNSPIYFHIRELKNMVTLASICTIKRLKKKPILPMDLLHLLKDMLISSSHFVPVVENNFDVGDIEFPIDFDAAGEENDDVSDDEQEEVDEEDIEVDENDDEEEDEEEPLNDDENLVAINENLVAVNAIM